MVDDAREDLASAQRLITTYLLLLIAIALLLGALHVLAADVRVGGVYWFNLDKERNFATWFSGALLFLFGAAAVVAYYRETTLKSEGRRLIRLPFLWLGVAAAGMLMSLDETTILHENLLWSDVRQTTSGFGDTWLYLTQWQVLFAPLILALLAYFVLFFSNRFVASRRATAAAVAGLGLWLSTLVVEGLRGTFKQLGDAEYSWSVVVEEVLEMGGSALLAAAIAYYILDISFVPHEHPQHRRSFGAAFLSREALLRLAGLLALLAAAAAGIYALAGRQAETGAPLPQLQEQAAATMAVESAQATIASLEPVVGRDEIWFDDLTAASELDSSLARDVAAQIVAAVAVPAGTTFTPPSGGENDSHPRMLFVSVSDGTVAASVVRGSGRGISEAAQDALLGVQELRAGGLEPKWIKIDFVSGVARLESFDPEDPLERDRSLYGVAFDRASGLALLPGQLLAETIVNSDQQLHYRNLSQHVAGNELGELHLRRLGASDRLTIYRFGALSYFSDGPEPVELFRGHRAFEDPSADDLLQAALEAGRHLVASVDETGRFVYSYLPKSDEEDDDYNVLRHAGTSYALLELYEATGEPEFLRAGEKTLSYLETAIRPCPSSPPDPGSLAHDPYTACVVEDEEVKLGGNALALIALAMHVETTGDSSRLPLMRRLGNWILDVQAESGEFTTHKITYPDGAPSDFESHYYPGEAVLALVRLHELDPDGPWLDDAAAGASWLIEVRDSGVRDSELEHDHWLLYALNELYRHRPEPRFLAHSSRIARAIVASQNLDPDPPDWRGSYYSPPRSTPTATRSEGLLAAYELARDYGDPAEAEAFLAAAAAGVSFQLATQFQPETAMYLVDPQRALGGFHHSLDNYEIRIDYVQHNISSLLALRRAILAPEN